MGSGLYMKNIVFIPSIDLGNRRNRSYEYSVKSWKHFCDKYDCELLVWEDLLYPIEYMKITWQRYYLFDFLEENKIEYNQILMVDADTIVHPDCPNFFNETDGKYCGVMNDGCYEWVIRSIRSFGDRLFNGHRIKPHRYINGGFQIVNKNHRPFFDEMKKYYEENHIDIKIAISEIQAGTDQTILNFMLDKHNVDVRVLPPCYNLQDLWRKNIVLLDDELQHWMGDELYFLEAGWVYHYNAMPANPKRRDASYWMQRTYKELYNV